LRVEALIPDTSPPPVSVADDGGFAQVLDGFAKALSDANRAEDAFALGNGTLQEAVYERAQADIALSVATATAQRLVQSVQSVLNMQV
jgi:flagellar hook-basal body complex protein FliE